MDGGEPLLVTKSRLFKDFTDLGVRPGGTVMLHASVKSVGWIVGGPDVILHALRQALGPDGRLMMYVGWEDNPYDLEAWPEGRRRAYLEECPPFDPAAGGCRTTEEVIRGIARFTAGLGEAADEGDIESLRFGGTEEDIISRGSDWCTDVARVACILCQVVGVPARIVNLFDLTSASSGHVVIEAYRGGRDPKMRSGGSTLRSFLP